MRKMQNTLSWYQTLINDQVGRENELAPVFYMRRVKPVHYVVARMKKDRSEIEMIDKNGNKTHLDMHSKLESDTPDDGKVMAVKVCLNH